MNVTTLAEQTQKIEERCCAEVRMVQSRRVLSMVRFQRGSQRVPHLQRMRGEWQHEAKTAMDLWKATTQM
jgi:hypothetical protein